MKFFSVAVVSMLFCAVVVYGAPSIDAENTIDTEIKKFRTKMECYDRSFIELAGEYKGLDKLYIEFKGHVEDTKLQLDDCEKIVNPQSKKECVFDIMMAFGMMDLEPLLIKLAKKNQELPSKLVYNC